MKTSSLCIVWAAALAAVCLCPSALADVEEYTIPGWIEPDVPVYQWRLNGKPIPGANCPDYNAVEEGYYDVVVTTDFGTQTSSRGWLKFLPESPPQIIRSTNHVELNYNERAVFTVEARGAGVADCMAKRPLALL